MPYASRTTSTGLFSPTTLSSPSICGNDRRTVTTAKTAADLFAHRHTIRYRLDRVKELTHLDVDKSEDRERLTLGIKSMQLLGRAPEKPSSFSDR